MNLKPSAIIITRVPSLPLRDGTTTRRMPNNEAEENDGAQRRTVRQRVYDAVSSRTVQLVLTLLLFVDIVSVTASLAIDSEYPSCRAALRVCNLSSNFSSTSGVVGSLHASHVGSHNDSHEEEIWCKSPPQAVQRANEILDIVSHAILLIFLVEILVTMASLGVIAYVTTPTYLFDGTVVIASVLLEFLMESRHHHDTGILVFARAWRFVALMNSMKAIQESKVDHLLDPNHHDGNRRRKNGVGGGEGGGEEDGGGSRAPLLASSETSRNNNNSIRNARDARSNEDDGTRLLVDAAGDGVYTPIAV